MSNRRSVGRGVGRKGNRNQSFNIEALEDRRLLSTVTFGTPVTTTLPNGFTPLKVQQVHGNAGFYSTDLLITGASGGALIVSPNSDGTFTTQGTVSSAVTVLGAASAVDLQNSPELVVFTTTGYMIQQQNGSFSAPAGYTLPADAVPGAAAIGFGFPSDFGTGPGLIIERFVPNSGDPTLGSIIVSTYYQNSSTGTFGQHKDTTVATNTSSPAGEAFLAGSLDSDGISDIVVNGTVWFGNADGSFRVGPSLGLTTAERAATLTLGSLYINGTQSNDLVLYPAPATTADPNSDAAQVFVNDGTGTFKRGPRFDLAPAGTTSGPLLIADLNADTAPDIAVMVTSGTGAPELAVAQGSVSNGFIGTVLDPLPANAQVVGLNSFLAPDLLALGTKVVSGSTRSVLETVPATTIPGPIITLTPSSSSVFVGQRVVISAIRSVNESAGATYTFLDGTTVIGSATVAADGSVQFATSSLAAGAHVITAVSSSAPGDVSAPLTLTVNADPPTGLVFATGLQAGLRAVEVPGDTPTLKLSLRNIGGATATTPLTVKLFASTTNQLTDSAIPIPDPLLANVNPNLGVRKDKTISAKMTIPDSLTPGTYFLIAQVGAAKVSGQNQVIGSTIVDFSSFSVAWQFGHVGTRTNVKFVQHLKSGVVTFSLTGNGYGVVKPGDGPLTLGNGGPDYQVEIGSTNIKSKLTISQTGSTKSNIVGLTLDSDVGTVDVRTDTPHLILPGPTDTQGNALGTLIVSVKQLSIGSIPTATLTPTASPSTSTAGAITVNGNLGQLSATSVDGATVAIGANASAPTKLKIGTLGSSAVIASNVPIDEIDLTTALAGSVINAPSLGKLKTSGNFSANMTLSGKTHGALVLGSVDIGGSVAGSLSGHSLWAVNGNIGDIKIRNSVAELWLLGGARLGPLGELTEPPAAFSGVSIKSLTIGGSVGSSLLSAGLDPVDGIPLNSNDLLLPGGSFGSITIGGVVDPATKIVASNLPVTATIGHQKTSTASDSNFALHTS